MVRIAAADRITLLEITLEATPEIINLPTQISPRTPADLLEASRLSVSQTNTTGKQETDKNQTTEGTQKTLAWKDISSQVKTVSGKKTLAITIEQGQQLDADILRNAIEQKISVTLQYGNYQWTFDGQQMAAVYRTSRNFMISRWRCFPSITSLQRQKAVTCFSLQFSIRDRCHVRRP